MKPTETHSGSRSYLFGGDHLEPSQTGHYRNITKEVEDFQLDLEKQRKRRFILALSVLVGLVVLGAIGLSLIGCSGVSGHLGVEEPKPAAYDLAIDKGGCHGDSCPVPR